MKISEAKGNAVCGSCSVLYYFLRLGLGEFLRFVLVALYNKNPVLGRPPWEKERTRSINGIAGLVLEFPEG